MWQTCPPRTLPKLCEKHHRFMWHLRSLDTGSQAWLFMGNICKQNLLLVSPFNVLVWGTTPSLRAPLQTAQGTPGFGCSHAHTPRHHLCATEVSHTWAHLPPHHQQPPPGRSSSAVNAGQEISAEIVASSKEHTDDQVIEVLMTQASKLVL